MQLMRAPGWKLGLDASPSSPESFLIILPWCFKSYKENKTHSFHKPCCNPSIGIDIPPGSNRGQAAGWVGFGEKNSVAVDVPVGNGGLLETWAVIWVLEWKVWVTQKKWGDAPVPGE